MEGDESDVGNNVDSDEENKGDMGKDIDTKQSDVEDNEYSVSYHSKILKVNIRKILHEYEAVVI